MSNKKRPIPKVTALLLHEGDRKFLYHIRYDCPWCGREHQIHIHENPPLLVATNCFRRVVIHRIEEPFQGEDA